METRGRVRMLAVVALSLMVGGVAHAQRQRGAGFGFGRGGGVQLLTRQEVQTELKLTDAQKSQIMELGQQLRNGAQQGQQLSPEERQKRTAETNAKINAILNAEQQKRYKEINLQQQGLSALASMPDVADEMKLTADQKSKIQEIMQAQRGQGRPNGANGDFSALRERMAAQRKERDDKILALLTDAQKTQWTAMLGSPFTLPPLQRRPQQ